MTEGGGLVFVDQGIPSSITPVFSIFLYQLCSLLPSCLRAYSPFHTSTNSSAHVGRWDRGKSTFRVIRGLNKNWVKSQKSWVRRVGCCTKVLRDVVRIVTGWQIHSVASLGLVLMNSLTSCPHVALCVGSDPFWLSPSSECSWKPDSWAYWQVW